MAQSKFIYDPETLSYIPVENTLKTKVKKLLPFVACGACIGIVTFAIVAFNFKTPTEKVQAQKQKEIDARQNVLEKRINDFDHVLTNLAVLDDSLYRSLFRVDPVPQSVRQAGIGGVEKYTDMINSDVPTNIIGAYKKLDDLVAKINVQKGSYRELFKMSIANVDRMQHLPAIIPISNWDLKYIGSGFSSSRFHPILKRVRPHEGIDFIARVGTDIYAAADGKVINVRFSDSFGRVVEIDHGYGITTLYAHMSKFHVKNGDIVKRGQVIGEVGNSGLSAGAHLHYEVHINGKEVDPVNYFFKDLTSDEYKAVVAQAASVKECME